MSCSDYLKPANPRLSSCSRCSMPFDTHARPEPTTRQRDLESEREITRQAARGVVDPGPLITFSEARAWDLSSQYVEDPGFVRLNDRLRETREEIADARNYLVWFVEENAGTDEAHDAFLALRHLLLAYELLGAK